MTQKSSSRSQGDTLVERGHLLVLASILIMLFGLYSSLLAPLLAYFEIFPVCHHSRCSFQALTVNPKVEVHRLIAEDAHYKYFPFIAVPAGLLFVIANWVGWQYYQNS